VTAGPVDQPGPSGARRVLIFPKNARF